MMLRQISEPRMTKKHRFFLLLVMVVSLLVACMQCKSEPSMETALPDGFAGSDACGSCHADIVNAHRTSAHFRTSAPAAANTVLGNFEREKNSYYYNRSVRVSMERRDSGMYQVEYLGDIEKKARRFDVVVGSGAKGQSFLTWRNEELFQLPITWFSQAKAWSNSPGFPDKVLFNRVITSRCIECHLTMAEVSTDVKSGIEIFKPATIMYGVDCEKCHGPAAEHVTFHTRNMAVTEPRHIINTATLSRQAQLELCAQCHGGRLEKLQPSFTYLPGKPLGDYFNTASFNTPMEEDADVHGNQYGLLRESTCFKKSVTMTCGTCHDPHKNEQDAKAVFASRCQSCHGEAHNGCQMKGLSAEVLTQQCIDCHMPLKPSKVIAVQMAGDSLPVAAQIRTHWIKVYPEFAKDILKKSDQ